MYVSLPLLIQYAVGQADDVFERLARCDRLLTAKELADILAISPKTLYNYVTRGMIPYFKIESNVRFRAREVPNGFDSIHVDRRSCGRKQLPAPPGDDASS
jgi:predicted DNA-binding transcriptional regulator AlpA